MHHMEHIWTIVMLKICKHTFYAYLSRIWKLMQITRFIQKVFATKILLSRKFLLFLILERCYLHFWWHFCLFEKATHITHWFMFPSNNSPKCSNADQLQWGGEGKVLQFNDPWSHRALPSPRPSSEAPAQIEVERTARYITKITISKNYLVWPSNPI